ncbi:MAG: hypothetical protein GXP08_15755 [Gammaproteobacteria bacterium]|nr:hypothetical protein [Gammaproteobacteria bacterium]
MTINFGSVVALIVLFFSSVLAVNNANADTSCKIIGSPGTFFLVEAAGETFNAMSQSVFAELKQRSEVDAIAIEKLKKQVAQYRETVGEYQQLTNRYEKLRQDHLALTAEYNSSLAASVDLNQTYQDRSHKLLQLTSNYHQLASDYDELAEKYRRVAVDTTSFIKLDLAAGVTSNNGDTEVAALIGVGFHKLKAWGFMQRDNSGLLIGTSYRF